MMTESKTCSPVQQPPKPRPAVQPAATLGDAAEAAAATEGYSPEDLAEYGPEAADPAELYEQTTEAFKAGGQMAQVMERLQADNESKDTLNREMIFMHTQLTQIVDKLKHAVLATGGTNFTGLVQLADQVVGQCTQVFANAMLTRYRRPDGGTETTSAPTPKAECTLCEGDGIPDIDEHGKKILRACPECGAIRRTEEPDLKVADTPEEVDVMDTCGVDPIEGACVSPTEADRQAVADEMGQSVGGIDPGNTGVVMP